MTIDSGTFKKSRYCCQKENTTLHEGRDRLIGLSVIFGNSYTRRPVLRESRVVKSGAGLISESLTALSISGVHRLGISDSEPVCALKAGTSIINFDRRLTALNSTKPPFSTKCSDNLL